MVQIFFSVALSVNFLGSKIRMGSERAPLYALETQSEKS